MFPLHWRLFFGATLRLIERGISSTIKEIQLGWWRYNLDIQRRSMLQQPCTSAYGYNSCNVVHASGCPSFSENGVLAPRPVLHPVALPFHIMFRFPFHFLLCFSPHFPFHFSVSLHFVCVRMLFSSGWAVRRLPFIRSCSFNFCQSVSSHSLITFSMVYSNLLLFKASHDLKPTTWPWFTEN